MSEMDEEEGCTVKAMQFKIRRDQMHLSVCMSNALHAASRVHVASCNIGQNSSAHTALTEAMHSLLIVAEECRQALETGRNLP